MRNFYSKAKSHCSDKENDNDHGIVLVELLHAEYAHAHSTNRMCSLCDVIVIVLSIAAVGPGLNAGFLLAVNAKAMQILKTQIHNE